MHLLRAFFMQHRALAFGLVVAALCMKMLIPAGMMIGHDSQTLTVQICADGMGQTLTRQISIPMKPDGSDPAAKAAKGDCAFSALGMTATAGADLALLAAALAFIMMLGFAAVRPSLPMLFSHLRPPLRGPPARLLTI